MPLHVEDAVDVMTLVGKAHAHRDRCLVELQRDCVVATIRAHCPVLHDAWSRGRRPLAGNEGGPGRVDDVAEHARMTNPAVMTTYQIAMASNPRRVVPGFAENATRRHTLMM